jgi:hypothetical protein
MVRRLETYHTTAGLVCLKKCSKMLPVALLSTNAYMYLPMCLYTDLCSKLM